METIEIIHGNDRVVSTVLEFISNANNKIDACMDSSRPSLALALWDDFVPQMAGENLSCCLIIRNQNRG
jgi:hypothetical protein